MRSVLVVVLLINLANLPSAEAIAGDAKEPVWRLDDENRWCFLLSGKKACLPSDYVLNGFEPGYANWSFRNDDEHSYLVGYEVGSPMDRGEDSLPGELFLVRSSVVTDSFKITEMAADLSRKSAHELNLFVVVFDDVFSITLTGVDTEGLRTLARSLTVQWSAVDD